MTYIVSGGALSSTQSLADLFAFFVYLFDMFSRATFTTKIKHKKETG